MQAVILAAGRGTRLRPITLTRSKAMAPIVGKPIVARVMEDLAACGVDAFVVVAHPNDTELTEYCLSCAELCGDVQIRFQSEQLGMAHALTQAAPLITNRFVLSACDSIVPTRELESMLELWREAPSLGGLLALLPAEPERIRSGATVAMDGPWITRIVEKPRPQEVESGMASLPLYCFSKRILDYLPRLCLSPRGEYELQEAIQMLIEGDAKVRGFAFSERLALTTAADLLALNRHYLGRGAAGKERPHAVMAPATEVVEPVFLEPGSLIGDSCTIGPDVYAESGCQIGDGVTISRAVVLRGAVVPSWTTVENEIIA